MTAYERQVRRSEEYYDAEMAELALRDAGLLDPRLRNPRSHEIIDNPEWEGQHKE